MQDSNDDVRTAKQAVKDLQGNGNTQSGQRNLELPHYSPHRTLLTAALPCSLLCGLSPIHAADVSSMLVTYHELAVNIIDTLETRLIQSLKLSTPDSTTHHSLAAILHQPHLTPAALSAAVPGSDVSAVWWRLYGRWCEVRELDVLLVGMMAGDEDVEQMDEVERRMRALGWEVPPADSSSSSGSRANKARGEAA